MHKGEPFTQMAAGFGVGATTTWRYIRETTHLLAEQTPTERLFRPRNTDTGQALRVLLSSRHQMNHERTRAINALTVLVRVNPARREELVGTALAARAEETDADGWLRLEVTVQDPRHAEWALWQLATNAEALAPQWLRTSLRDHAAAIATRYGEPS